MKIQYSAYSDLELTERYNRQDHTALTEIYSRYWGKLINYVAGMHGSGAAAEDIVQDLFTVMYAKIGKYQINIPLESYLYRAVRNKVLNLGRHNNYRKKYEADLEAYMEQGHCATDDIIASKELTIKIEHEIALLPKRMREVFEMSRKAYMTNKEIAMIKRIAPHTVKNHISNAIKILRSKEEYFNIQSFNESSVILSEKEEELLQQVQPIWKAIEPKQLILPETPRIITDIRFVNQKILDRMNRDPYEIHNLSPRQFEIMCAELYEERGYKVTLTQKTRDGGKDLIILDNRDIGNFKVYGECKRHAPDNPVSVNVVKQLAGNVWADNVTAGIVITSSYFSPDAKNFANQFQHRISLMDFNRLHQMMTIKPKF